MRHMNNPVRETMKPGEAAKILGCSVAHVRKLLNSGVLQGVKRPTPDGRRSSRSRWIVFADSVSRLLGRPVSSSATSAAVARQIEREIAEGLARVGLQPVPKRGAL